MTLLVSTKTVTKIYVTKSKLHFTTLVVRLGGFFQNDEENTLYVFTCFNQLEIYRNNIVEIINDFDKFHVNEVVFILDSLFQELLCSLFH